MDRKIALLGNPNSGKTSLFNSLTGLNQKVGNYPGVTVDKRSGSYGFDGSKVEVVDLPGIYGLNAVSEDEHVVADYLQDNKDEKSPDVFVVIADATNLERSFMLFTQLYDMQLPLILVVNMIDLVDQKELELSTKKLDDLLKDVPIVLINAQRGHHIGDLKQAVNGFEPSPNWQPFYKAFNGYEDEGTLQERQKKIKTFLSFIKKDKSRSKSHFSDKLDKVLIHPVLGYMVFGLVLFILFQLVYEFANWPMDLIDSGFAWLSGMITGGLPSGVLTDLIVEGIVPGLGGVLIFIPQITLLFLVLSLLEESGYMTRVVFLMDRIMRPFGLHGKSVVPMISGMACAIPAVMAARSIDQPKDRLITIMVTPLMSCSARLPVYALMIALVIPQATIWGIFNLQGMVLLGLYLLGLIMALLAALVFKLTLQPGKKSFLIMEMPSYKVPYYKNVLGSLIEKIKAFVFGAGKIILAISIILWVLGSYGPGSFNSEDDQIVTKVEIDDSYVGLIGQQIEPVISPLGYDWKIGIALITSFAAREVFVGTMATIYKVGDADETSGPLLNTMRNERNGEGKVVFSLATGLSLMVFYAFAMQCMSTVAVVKRETKSWKWPMVQLAYMTVLAYAGALLTYYIAS